MLKATEFDLKTGKTLTEYDPQSQSVQPKTQDISHTYLEHWLNHHGLSDRPLWRAKFYAGVNPADQQRLEQDGKVLVFANGETGYFSDPAIARLMTQGNPDLGIAPLYNFSGNSAHDLTAYGSLPISNGVSSTVIQNAEQPIRIWVVDEEKRDWGGAAVNDVLGQAPRPDQLDSLLNRLGDGMLLVHPSVARTLVEPNELRYELTRHLQDAAPSPAWIDQLALDYQRDQTLSEPSISPVVMQRIMKGLDKRARNTVSQFRAATPDSPGMLKGTMSSSALVEDLGVDIIASVSTVKGDDGQLSTPGIHEVSQLWLNRKRDGRYNTQAVGTQLKGTLPHATATELNPQVLERAETFAQIAGDVHQLAADYVQTQAAQRAIDPDPWQWTASGEPEEEKDWLSQIIQQDQYGVMLGGFPTVVDKLERFVRHERVDQALRGIRIPSAMAQPHGQLKPWEV